MGECAQEAAGRGESKAQRWCAGGGDTFVEQRWRWDIVAGSWVFTGHDPLLRMIQCCLQNLDLHAGAMRDELQPPV